jgi:hypothetical protein
MSARRFALFALLLVVPTACATRSVEAPPPSMGAQLSVERFLQAANERDVVAMGNLFGTHEGPLMDTGSTLGCAFKKIGSWFGGSACENRQNVEIRMDAIASILLHQDYRIVGQSRVAGRLHPTQQVMVDMTTDEGRDVSGVPFVVVQTGDGYWLVEQVDLQSVMAARG